MRPIDLARAAGISTQLVRNYADEGILPPTPRTESGYRTFEPRHAEAMHTFRALTKGYGHETARTIMRAIHNGDIPGALTFIDVSHADLHEQRQTLQAMADALTTVAGQTSAELPSSGMRIGELAYHLGVRTSALRVWESAGLLTPQREHGTHYRYFTPAEIRDARMIHLLRQGRYPLPQIQLILDGLRETGSTEALGAAVAERRESLNQRAMAMLEGASRLHHYLASEYL